LILGDENSHIPAGKTVIEYELSKLVTPDGKRILAEGIHLKIKGFIKVINRCNIQIQQVFISLRHIFCFNVIPI